MARTREVAGGGRAVEVEPERLSGWFGRFADRHGGLVASTEPAGTCGSGPPTARRPRSRCRSAGFRRNRWPIPPPCSTPCTPISPSRAGSGIVLVRLGGYSVGVAVGGVVETSTTGARLVHGRNRKGGSSSGRFARRRDNQARVALDAAADAVARVLLPVADTLDAIVLGGDAAALDDLRADRRLAALLARAEPRVLDVPEPRRAVLDEAARRALAVEVVVREPAPDP